MQCIGVKEKTWYTLRAVIKFKSMPKDLTRDNVDIGNVQYEWTIKEYEKYTRGRTWYVVVAVLAILLLTYAFLTENITFALIIILFGIVLYLHELQDPLDIDFAVTNTGIVIGRKYYRYSELEHFWIMYNVDIVEARKIYFTTNGYAKHRLQIPLLDYDPRPIREYLAQFLMEDLEQEEEPVSDKMARLLKIH
jgi:hypothetical protein